ncbi:acyl-CoA dehydrogenase family protein [uncultured Aeromicrobium sp.]|uniref:acyl-CoA dehydrogenase family protein n=1 Tax=uncultured Aeromicrobium sp. TaxID=337820 RepID=UPI0025E5D688|nr:acyl-CoA dehydrogenase family protein [uncultured Aeromicrobium sp.]
MYDNRSGNEELRAFTRSVTGALADLWPDATSAGEPRWSALHALAVEQGWFELGEAGAAEHLVALARLLGERACPLLVEDAYVASRLLPELAGDLASGRRRVALRRGSQSRPLVPAGAGLTDMLIVDMTAGRVALAPVRDIEEVPGLPEPTWSRVSVGEPVGQAVDPAMLEEALSLVRLTSAARLTGAVERAHRLSVTHATTRRQFGRPIGAFGAVQQRVAACHIDVTAQSALIDEAVQSLASGEPLMACALAARHARDRSAAVLAGAQHTLGAIGYFDEHEVAWLFRFVHAELTRLREIERALPEALRLERMLLAHERPLPRLSLGAQAEALRAEIRSLLDDHRDGDGFDIEGLRAAAADAGVFALAWPREYGGRGASLEEQVVVNEEMKYAGGPVDRAMSATMLIGHSLLRHGTDQQRAAFLPLLRDGRLAFCLGYSEPEAGSDLASLSTRAVRDGDDWVINGQKLWTTRAHTASHVWLAVRTDPEARPRHAGITIFLVPMDTPGITVHQHRALSGEISCTVFYDDVRVPDSMRVGEVDGGWRVITDALAAERVLMGGVAATLLSHFDALLDQLRGAAAPAAADLDRLAALAARLQAARTLVVAATRGMDGDEARLLGPVSAVLSGDLAEDFGRLALDLLGVEGLAAGRFEGMLRLAPMYVIGGGTNDVQRGIIARGLGLPRE